jgi:hypothetical protein
VVNVKHVENHKGQPRHCQNGNDSDSLLDDLLVATDDQKHDCPKEDQKVQKLRNVQTGKHYPKSGRIDQSCGHERVVEKYQRKGEDQNEFMLSVIGLILVLPVVHEVNNKCNN